MTNFRTQERSIMITYLVFLSQLLWHDAVSCHNTMRQNRKSNYEVYPSLDVSEQYFRQVAAVKPENEGFELNEPQDFGPQSGIVPDSNTDNVHFSKPLQVQENANNEGVAQAGITNFGTLLLKTIQTPDNLVFSPYSVAIMLGVLQQGALGITQSQINTALSMTPQQSRETFSKVLQKVQTRQSINILKIATGIFPSKSLVELKPDFINSAIGKFGSDVFWTDYNRADRAVKTINKWVSNNTDRFIKEIVTTNIVNPATELVLANAIFFKGIWKRKFNRRLTMSSTFYLGNGQRKETLFMRASDHFKVGFDQKIQSKVVIIPYDGDQYSMMVILPSQESNLDHAIRSLTVANLLEYHQFPPKEVILTLPKFTVRSDIDLKPILQQMGLTSLFDSSSDLSGIGFDRQSAVRLSAAVHTGLLSIDENGSVAAAASAFAAVALSGDNNTEYFNVDRPFLAVLWDNELSYPLFMAKIENPVV